MISMQAVLAGLRAIAPKASALRTRQERELRSMGDRELSDLGIGASEIPYLFRETKLDVVCITATTPLATSVALSKAAANRKLAL